MIHLETINFGLITNRIFNHESKLKVDKDSSEKEHCFGIKGNYFTLLGRENEELTCGRRSLSKTLDSPHHKLIKKILLLMKRLKT